MISPSAESVFFHRLRLDTFLFSAIIRSFLWSMSVSYLIRGSLAFDTILVHLGDFRQSSSCARGERFGGSFNIDAERFEMGGAAGNIAHNAALLGDSPATCSSLGESDGQIYLERLSEAGVDVSYINFVERTPTASCWIFTDAHNNQLSGYKPGASAVSPEMPRNLDRFSFALLSSEPANAFRTAAKTCLSKGLPYLLDPGPTLEILFADDDAHLSFSDILFSSAGLFVNEREAFRIEERLGQPFEQIAKKIDFCVMTSGHKGSTLFIDGKTEHIPACKPDNIEEPTGCGDAFRAGFMHVICHGGDKHAAARLGSVMASFPIECIGAQNHAPSPDEIYRRYVSNFGAWPVRSVLFDELVSLPR